MSDRRRKNAIWFVTDEQGKVYWPPTSGRCGATLALLMDIRDELQRLNEVLHCSNFLAVPRKLDRIARNTAKPRRRRRKEASNGNA
jgi:hypothetical protein